MRLDSEVALWLLKTPFPAQGGWDGMSTVQRIGQLDVGAARGIYNNQVGLTDKDDVY